MERVQLSYRDHAGRRGLPRQLGRQARWSYPIEVRQISIRDFKERTAVSPAMSGSRRQDDGPPLPYRRTAGQVLAATPPERFGCTVCHGRYRPSRSARQSCGADRPDGASHPPLSPRRHRVILRALPSGDLRHNAGRHADASSRQRSFEERGALAVIESREGRFSRTRSHERRGKSLVRSTSPACPPENDVELDAPAFCPSGDISPGSVMPAFALTDEEAGALIVAVRGSSARRSRRNTSPLPLGERDQGSAR